MKGDKIMNVLTVRLPEKVEKKIRTKAKLEHRTISEQIHNYLYYAIASDENPDLPLSFIRETLAAKAEIEAGLGENYEFGVM